MTIALANANALHIPLPDESVHCVVTSPPYFGLRDYGIDGQIGLEQTPDEYVAKLVRVFREVRRVLHPTGVVFLNLGDSYFGSNMTGGTNSKEGSDGRLARMFKRSDHAQHGQSYGSSGRAKSGCRESGYPFQNLHDVRKGIRYFRTLDTPHHRAPKRVHEFCLRILGHIRDLTDHLPSEDYSLQQAPRQSFAAILDLLQNDAHDAGQLLSSLESMPDESFPRPQDRYRLLGSLLVLQSKCRSLADGARVFAHRWDDSQAPTGDSQNNTSDAALLTLRSVCKDTVYECYNIGASWLNLPYVQPHYTTEQPYKPKDLMGMPWRVALALQADGWWLRSDIIWHKTNPMPESVTDRPTKSHEYLFLLSKAERYFYDADAVREEGAMEPGENRGGSIGRGPVSEPTGLIAGFNHSGDGFIGSGTHNRRTVWTISTKPYSGAHYATFPPDLVEPCIKAGTSERGVCPDCAAPWERVVEKEFVSGGAKWKQTPGNRAALGDVSESSVFVTGGVNVPRTTGWRPTCDCLEIACPTCAFVVKYPHVRTNDCVRQLWKEVSSSEEKPQVLLAGVLQRDEAFDAENLRVLRRDIYAQKRASEVLRQDVCEHTHGEEPGEFSGLVSDDERLHSGIQAGPPKVQQGRLHHGASASDGGGAGPASKAERGSAPQKRQEGRQPTQESKGDEQKEARRRKESKVHGNLSVLRGSVSGSWECPHCTSGLVARWPSPKKATILDPFAGSGTTGVVARALGRDAVLLDLSLDYLRDNAKERLELDRLEAWQAGNGHRDEPEPAPLDGLPLFDGVG